MYEDWIISRVCAFGSANCGQVVYDSDSETETKEKDHVEKPEPKSDDPTPTKFESIEQVMSLLPTAGVDDLLEEAQLVRIQNPLPKLYDWKRVDTTYKYRCKTSPATQTQQRLHKAIIEWFSASWLTTDSD